MIHISMLALQTLAAEYKEIASGCLVTCLILGIFGVLAIYKLAGIEDTHVAHLEALAFLLNYGLTYTFLLIMSVERLEKKFGFKQDRYA